MSWARNSVGAVGDDVGLPDVTTADNGKIMEVEDGEWKLKEGSGGGGGIPAPADPSDGDVLTYDSSTSAWVAEAPSGGGDIFLVTVTAIVEGGETVGYTTSKTAGEIVEAITANKILFTFYDGSDAEGTTYRYSLVTDYMVYEGTYYITSANNEYSASSLSDYMVATF